MKLLFVLGQVYPNDDTNSLLMTRLSKELRKIQPNISVFFLGSSYDEKTIHEEEIGDINVSTFKVNDRYPQSTNLQTILRETSTLPSVRRLTKLIRHPLLLIELLIKQIVNGNLSSQYKYQINDICKKHSIDILVGVCAPFNAAFGASKANYSKVPFIFYQLDPYFKHYLQPNYNKAIRLESYVCKKATAIIMSDLIYRDYECSPLRKFLYKTSVLEYPAFSNEITHLDNQNNKPSNKNECIRLVFVGSLYGDIRSPLYLLQIVYHLIGKGIQLHLDFVGPVMSPLGEETEKYIHLLGNTVSMHGQVDSIESKAWMNRADILVNISNAIPNQMPSKIFEYFSTGKPIINLYKLEDCPTLKYMKRYPYAINIPELLQNSQDHIGDVLQFIRESKGKQLCSHQVESLFPDCTLKAVAEQFFNIITSVNC